MASIESQLKNMQNSLLSGEKAKAILLEEAHKLKEILDKVILDYYASYNPKVYHRTYDFKYSVKVESVKEQAGKLSVVVYFEDKNVTRDGAYLPILLNDGWGGTNGSRYHFDYYEGFNFIEKAVDKYNSNNPYKIKVIIHRG